jgi:pSer/pThr/pTyr-binding forkhead associated (FHA) protein
LDLFLEACGAKGPLDLRIEHPGTADPVRWVLHQPFALVGREYQADVSLRDKHVSPRHAYVQVLGGHVFCTDLRGTSDVADPEELGQSGWIPCGDWVDVGSVRVGLASGGEEDVTGSGDPLAPGDCDEELLPPVRIEFLHDTIRTPPWRMNRVMALIGRSAHCKVRLRSPTVSRVHCCLVRTPKGVWVVDLCGREGTLVNGARVRFALLEVGDQLQIGEFKAQAYYENPATAPKTGRVAPLVPVASSVAPSAPFANGLALSEEVLANGGASGGVLVPLFNQFALMQQQMFDQFQQALVMTMQTFGSMHREQMGLVRQELDRLHELTRELHELQRELPRHRANGSISPSQAAEVPVAETLRPADPMPVQTPPPKRKNPPEPAVTPEMKKVAAPEKKKTDQPNGERPPAQKGEDVHLWLTQRIAAIQEERQGLWNRLMGMLKGKAADHPMP